MPRINIDDELRVDPRFHTLCSKIPRHEAFGSLVCLWEIGQTYWKRGKSLIPETLAEQLPHVQMLVDCEFALWTEGGLYCFGAEERWSFLLKRAEAGAKGGRSSAEARLEKYGSALPMNAKNSPKQNRSKTEAPTEASMQTYRSPPKPSSSSSSSEEKNNTNTPRVAYAPEFETLWRMYPRKVGKKLGMTRALAQLKTPDLVADAHQAITNYNRYVEVNKTEPRYIKQFSTFMNCWQDWVNPDSSLFQSNKIKVSGLMPR
jgi:hypothetical protein